MHKLLDLLLNIICALINNLQKSPVLINILKVVGNEKVGGSGVCQSVPIWLGPRRSRFVSPSILPSSLILSISISATVKQND